MRAVPDERRVELVGRRESKASIHDEFVGVAVVVGVEEFAGEGQALLGADFGALAALDALGDEDPDLLGAFDEVDGVGGADFDAQLAADAGLAVVGRFPTQFFGDGDGGIQGGFAFADLLQQSGDGGGELGGGEGIGVRFLEEAAEQFLDHREGHGRSP